MSNWHRDSDRAEMQPPKHPRLSIDEVHVWCADLDVVVAEALDAMELSLSHDERRRAGTFRFERDRHRYVVAHGLLRVILGRYLDVDPRELLFGTASHGRPILANPPSQTVNGSIAALGSISFSMSHSGGKSAFAIAAGRDVGVDIELMKADFPYDAVAPEVCSPREMEEFRWMPDEERLEAFFRCWVRKEAYLKARGLGLSADPRSVTVALTPGSSHAVLATPGDQRELDRWRLIDLPARRGLVGAVAVSGGDCRVRFWALQFADR